jgi:hypothetical protein
MVNRQAIRWVRVSTRRPSRSRRAPSLPGRQAAAPDTGRRARSVRGRPWSASSCGWGWWISSLPAGRALGPGRGKAAYSEAGEGTVRLIHDRHDPRGGGMMAIDELLAAVGEVEPGSLVADCHVPPAAEGRGDQKQVDHTALDLFRVVIRIGRLVNDAILYCHMLELIVLPGFRDMGISKMMSIACFAS